MIEDKKWRESAWEEVECQMKALFVDGSADFFIGFKAEEIPILIDAFERMGNLHLVDVLKEKQNDVGQDRIRICKEVKARISQQREEHIMHYLDEHPDVYERISDWKLEIKEEKK